MDEQLGLLLREVDRKKTELAEKPNLSPDADEAYREQFLYRSIYHNNAIEGNQLTQEEIQRMLQGNEVIPNKPLSDHIAVVGCYDAIRLARRYVAQQTRITEHEIRNLHYRMLISDQEASGVYRNYNLMINGHRPTSYEKIAYKMLQLSEAKPSECVHPIEAIAFYHLRFEKIHPFGDGNGRVGRLIINLMLEQQGYPPVIIKLDDRATYYDALNAYDGLDGKPQVKPMQILLAKLISEQLDELLAL
ncbi:MAG: Fic family protein [Actinomycetia bacterium]|nr:Fic family protein [Actinomycetes bacterium]